jgi:hypothetical protein
MHQLLAKDKEESLDLEKTNKLDIANEVLDKQNLVCLSDHLNQNVRANSITHDIDFRQVMVQKKYTDRSLKALFE